MRRDEVVVLEIWDQVDALPLMECWNGERLEKWVLGYWSV